MQVTSTYESPVNAVSTIALPATLTTTETDLYVVTDQKFLHKSQLTIYASVTLGGVASATFYYYLTDNGTTWYPICLYNTSTGEITQRAVLVDSGSYASGGVSYYADNVPMGAAIGLKITGKSASGTPAYTVRLMTRDN